MSTPVYPHIGDIGTVFRVTIKNSDGAIIDCSSATVIRFSFLKPTGISVSKVGSFYTDGSDGIVQWITSEATDLDIKGLWLMQVYIELDDGSWYTTKDKFNVNSNIATY